MTRFRRPEKVEDFNPVRPPEVHAVLSDVFSKRGIPDFIPHNLGEAAHWWLNHQEPADPSRETPEKIISKEGEIVGWTTPYHDRLKHNLCIFLDLQKAEQLFIADVWQQRKIAWRGDTMPMFIEICEQRKEYDDDPEGFIKRAIEQFKNAKIGQPS